MMSRISFPSEASIIRLFGAVLLKANDEWPMQHRYRGVEAMGEMLNPPTTNETLQPPPKAARPVATLTLNSFRRHVDGHEPGAAAPLHEQPRTEQLHQQPLGAGA
jgi:hypothetical protein